MTVYKMLKSLKLSKEVEERARCYLDAFKEARPSTNVMLNFHEGDLQIEVCANGKEVVVFIDSEGRECIYRLNKGEMPVTGAVHEVPRWGEPSSETKAVIKRELDWVFE